MRGEDRRSEGFFSYVRLEARIAADHPLRAIHDLVDEALGKLSAAFTRLYAREGRPSIPPTSGCRRTIRCGMRPYFARTGIGCSTAISRASS